MKGYLLVADLLGFSNLIVNLSNENSIARIREWTDLIDFAQAKAKISNVQLVSDTVFAFVESESTDNLRSITKFAQILLNEGIRKSLPIRGEISFGDVEWGRLIYGKAVISAYQALSAQDWIGVACQPDLPNVDHIWGFDSLVCYSIPKDDGPILLAPAVVWEVPSSSELMTLLMRGGLTKEGEMLSWKWARKVEHTVKFGLYLRALKAMGETGNLFRGYLPIQAIEARFQMFSSSPSQKN